MKDDYNYEMSAWDNFFENLLLEEKEKKKK